MPRDGIRLPSDADTRKRSSDAIQRRRFLAGAAAGLSALSAGCGTGSGTPSPSQRAGSLTFTDRPTEILHGWTVGDGARAIRAVEELFRDRHPDVRVDFHPVMGTGNDNLNSAVERRLANGNPPSSFAAWPGPNLEQYEGLLQDVSAIWEANGFGDAMHPAAGEYAMRNGGVRAIPIGSHRVNNLFLNTAVIENAGVDPDSLADMEGFVSALETIAAETDAIPLAHAMHAPWPNLQLVVWTLLAQAGTDAYGQFIEGSVDRSTVVEALETTKSILSTYVNDDASTINFTEANRKFIRGEAAMFAQGSWVYAMYRAAEEFEYDTDWEWRPFPGTDGMYGFHLDAFTFPTENPTPQQTEVWVAFVGQPEPQVAFGNRKGSVPVRLDIDEGQLDGFLTRLWSDLTDSTNLVPTFTHGLAVGPGKLADCKSVIADHFMGPFDVEATADGLLDVLGS